MPQPSSPSATLPRVLRPRVIRGLTYRQSIALRKLHVLKEEFAAKASLMGVDEMKRIADECYRLTAMHFPQEHAKIVSMANVEARLLAV